MSTSLFERFFYSSSFLDIRLTSQPWTPQHQRRICFVHWVNADQNGKEQKASPASGDLGTHSKPTPQTDVLAVFTSEEVNVIKVPTRGSLVVTPRKAGTDQVQPQWCSFYKTKGPQSGTPAAQSTPKARALTLCSQCHGRRPLLNTLSQKQSIPMSSHAWMQTAEWGVMKGVFLEGMRLHE